MGAWIFLIIFFGIIASLVIVAMIGSRKDKMEKLVENDKRRKSREAAEFDRVAIFSYLNKLITELETELADFKPSVGIKSLGDINKEVHHKIKSLSHSIELKNVYHSHDYKIEMKPIIDELSKHKPSTWFKEAIFATGLVRAKFESLTHDDSHKDGIAKGQELEWH